jgi:hypothetical protein
MNNETLETAKKLEKSIKHIKDSLSKIEKFTNDYKSRITKAKIRHIGITFYYTSNYKDELQIDEDTLLDDNIDLTTINNTYFILLKEELTSKLNQLEKELEKL